MKLHCRIQGDISSRAIVFVHGNSLSGLAFKRQFDVIKHVPLLSIDIPGHGFSPKADNPKETYSLSGYINALKQTIDEYKLSDYIIVGHSLGGHIALEASNELRGLKGILIFGTPPLGIPPNMENAFLPNPLTLLFFKRDLVDSEIDSLCKLCIDVNSSNNYLLAELKEQVKKTEGEARSYLLQNISEGNMKDEISIVKNLQIPLAILHGEKDAVVNPVYFNLLQYADLWQQKIHLIKDAGHTPQMEQPQIFNEKLIAFYNDIFDGEKH